MSVIIDGSASVTINSGAVLGITSGTAVASTSGTSIDFTSIPSWVKRITVMFSNVSLSGTAAFVVQAGSGSILNLGYTSGGVTAISSASSSGGFSITTGWQLNDGSTAASLFNGSVVLTNVTSNAWMESGTLSNSIGTRASISGGSVSLSGALDRIRITSTSTDTFDAGTINILYEG